MKKSTKIILGILVVLQVSLYVVVSVDFIRYFKGMYAGKKIRFEQSQKNFDKYETELKKIAEKHGYKLEENEDFYEGSPVDKGWKIVLNGAERIEISLSSDGESSVRGTEHFYVDYILWGSHAVNREYDTQLFSDIVNVMSGKKIKPSMVSRFLDSDDNFLSEYDTDKKIRYSKTLDFWENWQFEYVLTLQDEGILSFYGLTEQIEG